METGRINNYVKGEMEDETKQTPESNPISLFTLLPISLAIINPFTVVLTTFLAIYYGHVHPVFPYLSDSGATHPEAGFFSFLLSLQAIINFALSWVRYKQVAFVCDNLVTRVGYMEFNRILVVRINKLALFAAAMVSFGMVSVSAFRSSEHMLMHAMSAGTAFQSLAIVIGLQTWISYKLVPIAITLTLARIRLYLTVFTYLVLVVCLISCDISFIQAFLRGVPLEELAGVERLKWGPNWGGYEAHVVSAITEIIGIVSVSPIYASFTSEFNRIYLQNGKIKFHFRDVVNQRSDANTQTETLYI